jgi:EmrB/QacA subfamily drug resistance transporter
MTSLSDDQPTTSHQQPATNNQPPDYSRKWYIMAAVGMGIFLSTVDGSIVNIALPTLEAYFDSEFAIVQWVVLAYLLIISILILGVGRLADMIGKKPIYTAGFVIFTAGSVLCGLAPSIYWLIGFRALQAIGAAMILALGFGIITEAFPSSERGKALGITGTITSIGIVVGPTLGGLLIEGLSWRWIFFVNLPVGIAGTLLAIRYVPNIKPPGGQRFDFLGAATLFIGLLALLLALTFGQQTGFDDRRIVLLLAGSILVLALFIGVEWYADQPMIDLRLFRNSNFSVGLVTGFITFMTIAATVILLPFYLEKVLGYSPREVGFLMAVVPIALGIAAPLSGILSDRAPRRRLGIVSGMLAITRTLGQTTGLAILGAVWASRVFYYAGEALIGGATGASGAAQSAGLQDTFLVMVAMIVLALILALWALIRSHRSI